ncbi:MAG TPA: hypothetical protein VJ260_08440, partial [Vicinamibacterales bacterium]|nr:hypothetical protein [Vicinamibacterales bacterium]
MGGDHAPGPIVDGAVAAARHVPRGVRLVGRHDEVARELARHADAGMLPLSIVDAPDVVAMAESPAVALRRKPGASIRVAVQELAEKRGSGLVSAGSTGATVMAAYSGLGLLHGVDRPALATTIPTRQQPAVLLDAGANAECRPGHLLQFAVMGSALVDAVEGKREPTVGLLNIGEEAIKGGETIKQAGELLRAASSAGLIKFHGNV